MARFGKPAAVALTVAAISSSSLWPSAATAAPGTGDRGPSDTTRSGLEAQTSPAYELLSDGEDTKSNAVVERGEPVTYTVKPGDEVRAIARSFGLQTMTVVWNNDLPDPDLIFPDQELLILPVDGVMVEVQPGDTLNDLATKYGASTTAIVNYEPNGIADPDLILPGQTLIIPGGSPPAPVATEPSPDVQAQEPADSEAIVPPQSFESDPVPEETPVVDDAHGESIEIEPGDTLASVAQRFGVTIDELAQANQISDIDVIQSGEILVIPGDEVAEESRETPEEAVDEPQPMPDEETTTEPPAEPDLPTVAEPLPTEEPAPTASPEPTAAPEPERSASPEPDPSPEPEQPEQSAAPSDIPGLLEYYANQYGVDANLLKAIAWRESGWDQSATSSMGAQGVMQIMPTTGTYINNNLVSRDLNIRGNAADNIEAGAAYLAQRIDQMGSVERGVAAYFMGPVWVQNNGVTGAARTYVDRIYEIRDYIATHDEPPSWR